MEFIAYLFTALVKLSHEAFHASHISNTNNRLEYRWSIVENLFYLKLMNG
jgi:hypothetical protein